MADNSDDDNENDIMDKEEHNVTCEDDVLETILYAWEGEPVGGNVVLSRSTPGVRLWRNPRKVQSSDEVAFGTYSFEEFISTVAGRYLWLEGCQPGATVLSLSFQGKTDDADITVYGVDLELHKPAVIDANQAALSEASESVDGGAVFVNLDDDDADGVYDHADRSVAGGDNELALVTLKVVPPLTAQGTVRLTVPEGSDNIAIWPGNDKVEAAYIPGTALSVPADFTASGSCYVKSLWVEGVSPHTVARSTRLQATYECDTETSVDEAALTVVGVESVAWSGQGNSVSDANTLDADANWPTSLSPQALRVFPDARVVNGSVEANPRDKVNVNVTLSVQPPESVKLYLRSFDVDDPTSDASPVDDESNAADNRTELIDKEGILIGRDASKVKELVFPKDTATAQCEFQVSMQPGDSFRLVANADSSLLANLENDDNTLGSANADKQRIVNKHASGAYTDREVRFANKYCSPALVVWRFLHVEVDSMQAPPTSGAERNTVAGNVTSVSGGSVADRVDLDVNLRTGLSIPDQSENLSTGTEFGRFETGTITIGSGSGAVTTQIEGNGDAYVRQNAGINIPVVVSQTEKGDVIACLKALGGTGFILDVTSGTLTPDYVGGTLSVVGLTLTVAGVSGNIVTVTTAPTIPFELRDDDATSHPFDPGFGLMQASDTATQNLVKPAYIRPRYDDLVANGSTPPFNMNIEDGEAPPGAESQPLLDGYRSIPNMERYWSVYLQGAYQGRVLEDDDPDSEVCDTGYTPYSRSGSFVYCEALADSGGGDATLSKTTIHEVGHQFTLQHEANSVMQQGYPVPLLFVAKHLDYLRYSVKPGPQD